MYNELLSILFHLLLISYIFKPLFMGVGKVKFHYS